MLTMSAGIALSAAVGGGDDARDGDVGTQRGGKFRRGFGRLLGGENAFTAQFRAKSDGQSVTLAPDSFGDIVTLNLTDDDDGFLLTRGAYLANTGATQIRAKYGGVKGLLSKKGLFLLQATGAGTVFCQSYGAVVHRELGDGEVVFVDNRFVVAFSSSIEYRLVKATESIRDTVLSGEGLINRYAGPGHLYYQTRGKPGGGMMSMLLDAVF